MEAAAQAVMRLAREILSEPELEDVLGRVLGSAKELTAARYAALGILDDDRVELSRFLTLGISAADEREIGPRPRGRGVLGELIRNPVPLRLADIGSHPHAYGFPPAHPEMRTFLGVPILIGGEPFGNLYLTEKAGGQEFDERDEEAAVLLAEFAGLAIEHARRLDHAEQRSQRLQRTVDALDATVTISRTLAVQTDLDLVLDLVAKRGRALVSARALVIELEEAGGIVVAGRAGEVPRGLVGRRLEVGSSLAGLAMRTGSVQRLDSETNRARYAEHGLGSQGLVAAAGLVVPLMLRGQAYGALIAVDRLEDGPEFTKRDEELLEAFAASAAAAVATARHVSAQNRSQRLEATEEERSRFAHELRGTIEQLGTHNDALGGLVDSLPEQGRLPIDDLSRSLTAAIEGLQSLVTDLRPAALDSLGIAASLGALAEHARNRGLAVELEMDLAYERGRAPERLDGDLELAVYRIVQEALQNTIAHASARSASVAVLEGTENLRISVLDDGDGFDPQALEQRSGLEVMRERVELLAGTLEIESTPAAGTAVRVELPAKRRSAAAAS